MSSPGIYSTISSTATAMPDGVTTIEDFVRAGIDRALVEEWGVLERRECGDETATDLEARAGLLAIKRAGLEVGDIDLIIGSATLAEKISPPNVTLTQSKIGALHAACFGVDLACAGPIPAMMTAHSLITTGQYKNVLLVASNHGKVIDPTDACTWVTVGPGAAAIVMRASKKREAFLGFDLIADGRYWGNVGVELRAPRHPELAADPSHKFYFYIDENSGFGGFNRYALTSVPTSVKQLFRKTGVTMRDVNWVVSHQNFKPVHEAWFKSLEIPKEKVILTHSHYGNVGAANVWTNLEAGVKQGKFADGDLILFMCQGAGLAAGSALLRWSSDANRIN